MRSYTDWERRKFYYNKFIRVGFCICMVGLVLINASQLWAEEPYYKGKVLILFNNFPPGVLLMYGPAFRPDTFLDLFRGNRP